MKAFWAALLGLSLLACSGGKRNVNDPDSAREKAEAVPLGGRVQDRLEHSNAEGEILDNVDWKVLDVPAEGKLRVSVLFGNPVCFCSVELYDPKGKSLKKHADIKKEPRVDWIISEAKPGRYLLKFAAKYRGDFSEYAVEPIFAAAPKVAKSQADPEEDPIPTPEAPKDPQNTPAATNETKLATKITKSKPGRTGYLLLTLDKGSADGVQEGTQGIIEGIPNGELRVTKVEASSCQAETAVTAKNLKGHNSATLTLKK